MPRQKKRLKTYNVVGEGGEGPAKLGGNAGDDAKEELDEKDEDEVGHPCA